MVTLPDLYSQTRTSPFEMPPAAAPQDEVLAGAIPWPPDHQDGGSGSVGPQA